MHVLTLQEAYAYLDDDSEEKSAVFRKAQKRFLANHLVHWVKALAARISVKAERRGFYSSLGQFIDLQIDREINILGLELPPVSMASIPEPEEMDHECGTPPVQV